MIYLAQQLSWLLAAAFIVGLVIGWIAQGRPVQAGDRIGDRK